MRTFLEERIPKCGDQIIYFPGELDAKAGNNGAQCIPGVLVQVWGDHFSSCANIKVIPDDGGVLWRTSQSHAMENLGYSNFERFATNLNANNSCWVYKEEYDAAFDLMITKRKELQAEDPMSMYTPGVFDMMNQYFQLEFLKKRNPDGLPEPEEDSKE